MLEAIGAMLPAAAGVALSPFPIVGVVLMLATPRGRVNGPMFLVGWLAGLTTVGVIVLAVSDQADASDGGEPATWASVLQLALGAGLLLLALRQWRARPGPGDEPETPSWMTAVDHFSAMKALGLGFLLSAVNPKNLLLTIAASAAIASVGLSDTDQALAELLFILIASVGVIVPVTLSLVLGSRSEAMLDAVKTWMAANNAAIMAVILLLLGLKVLGDGLAGLA